MKTRSFPKCGVSLLGLTSAVLLPMLISIVSASDDNPEGRTVQSRPTTTSAPSIRSTKETLAFLDFAYEKQVAVRQLSATVRYTRTYTDPVEGKQGFAGEVYAEFEADRTCKYCLTISEKFEDNTRSSADSVIGFDGRFYKIIDHQKRTCDKYEIIAEGEKANPFDLESGPLIMPFGMKREDITRVFLPLELTTDDKLTNVREIDLIRTPCS